MLSDLQHSEELNFIDPVRHAILITSFVMVIMLIIEYLNVQTRGSWSKHLRSSSWLQILFAGFFGILPGCLGTFTVVSLYAHRVMNFASLVTVMIATFGDEAFIMMAMIPETYLFITVIILGLAITTGFVLNLIPGIARYQPFHEGHRFHIHTDDHQCSCFRKELIIPQLLKVTFTRALLILGFMFFIILVSIGEIGPNEWDWVRIVLFVSGLVTLLIVTTVPEHFLTNHIWEHIIKKHFLRIFLWTLGTLIVLHFIEDRLEIQGWISSNLFWVILLAAGVGLLPTSGPHLVFISLFVSGTIPLSVLLVNSIVQDGHGSLPLLAESKRSFIYMKFINLLIAIVIGFFAMSVGW